MTTTIKSKSVSLINLILSKESLVKVTNAVRDAGAHGIFQISARGSILTEGGFLQKMFPPPAPEQLLIQVLVGNDSIEAVVDAAVKAGDLSKVGAGAVFTINCDEAIASSRFPSNLPKDEFGETNNLRSAACPKPDP